MAAFYNLLLLILLPLPCLFLSIYLLFTRFWYTVLLYLLWMYYDKDTPFRGGRASEWFRNQAVWRYLANYFPIKLIKTVDLPTDQNYLFGYHPHGIMGLGCIMNFCTNSTDFPKLYPGLHSVAATLNSHFYIPFRREFVIAYGAISASGESLDAILSDKRKGRCVAVIVGGAEEALDSHADNFDLNLKSRKGFVKIAIRNGASLVPVYSFGETHLYNQIRNPKGSRLRNFQTKFKKVTGIAPALCNGRGFFNYSFGILPHRKSINTIVGAPIPVKQNDEPSAEEIDKIHDKYCEALRELFNAHKANYGITEETQLNIC